MTNEKALEGFENLLADIDQDNHLFVGTINPEFVKAAIEAIEKQIPMEPGPKELAEEQHFKVPTYIIPCGNCGEPINFLHSYCPWCGQRILETTDDNL